MADFSQIARKRDKMVSDLQKLSKQLDKSAKSSGSEDEFTPKLAKQYDYDLKAIEKTMKDLEKFYKEVQKAAK